MVNPGGVGSYLVPWFMLLSIIVCQEYLLQVKGDESPFIVSVCLRTTRPAHCIECLQSIPHREQKDLKGLAGTSINCIYNQALSVRHISTDFATNSTGPIKEEMTHCLPFIDSLSNHVLAALLTWRNNKFLDAVMELRRGGDEFEKCTSQLGESFTPSQGLIREFAAVNALTDISGEILKMLG